MVLEPSSPRFRVVAPRSGPRSRFFVDTLGAAAPSRSTQRHGFNDSSPLMRASGSMRALLAAPFCRGGGVVSAWLGLIAVAPGGQGVRLRQRNRGSRTRRRSGRRRSMRGSTCYGLGPRGPAILASINFHEIRFGRDLGLPRPRRGPHAVRALQLDRLRRRCQRGRTQGAPGARPTPFAAAATACRRRARRLARSDLHRQLRRLVRRRGRRCPALRRRSASSAVKPPPRRPEWRARRMLGEAERLDRLHLVYVWGGSHGQSPTPPNGPFDCSSAVSHLLQVGGFGNPIMDTIGLPAGANPAPGTG